MLKVAICVSEAVPFAKTGGLADVAGALPYSLKKKGVDSIVIMPGYNFIFNNNFVFKKDAENIRVNISSSYVELFDLFSTNRNGINFFFVKNEKFFNRENLYGTSRGDYRDNYLRFCFFARAIFKVLENISYEADILHIHDYHFALATLFLKDIKNK